MLVEGEITPHAAPVQFGPVTVQITPRLDGSFRTVATSGKVPLIWTDPLAGAIDTEAGSWATPVVMVICPVILQLADAGQLIMIWLLVEAPVPLREAVCGEPEALSEMLTVAVREPTAVGVNVRTRVQVAAGATVTAFLQVLAAETAKSPGFVPLSMALVEKVRLALPVLVIMIV